MSALTRHTAPTGRQLHVEFGAAAEASRDRLIDEYVSTLALPPDDMWAAFADMADAVAVFDNDELIGTAAIDADGELHRCYLRSGHVQLGPTVLDLIAQQRPVRSMIVATTDPVALTVLLPRSRSANPVALLYHHETDPDGPILDRLGTATDADHDAAVTFVAESTGGAQTFIDRYVGERIDRGELFLHTVDERIAGIGERRFSQLVSGYAHLGIVVDRDRRSRGMGGALMNTLVRMCRAEQLTPLCSTAPDNIAAQRAIHRAGFRSRHSVFRLEPADGADGSGHIYSGA